MQNLQISVISINGGFAHDVHDFLNEKLQNFKNYTAKLKWNYL